MGPAVKQGSRSPGLPVSVWRWKGPSGQGLGPCTVAGLRSQARRVGLTLLHPCPPEHACAEVLAAALTRAWGPQWRAGVTPVLPVLLLSAWPRCSLALSSGSFPVL